MSCKIREIENSRLAKFIGFNITLYPFIFYYGVPLKTTRNHEFIHVEQIRKLGVFKFYFMYLYYYYSNRNKGMDHLTAYYAIPFEIEAYGRQNEERVNA